MVSELTLADISGASSKGWALEAYKIAELKFWLYCCGASRLSKLKQRATTCSSLYLILMWQLFVQGLQT